MKKNNSKLKKTALVSALLLELTTVSQAANIIVDGTTCTLDDAVIAANTDAVAGGCSAGSGADSIELPANGNLTANSLIQSEVTINGNGSTVDGGAVDTVFRVYGGSLTINDVTVTNGYSPMAINYGGGLKCANGGELYVNRSTIAVNKGSGVLIDNCTATIMSSQVNNNTCIPYHQFPFPLYYMSGVGAGITVVGATANIENSTISNNICHSYYGGGGISIFDSTVTISNSTISGNESFYCAGGICAFRKFTDQPIVDLTLSQVTVVSNRSIHSSGGIANQTRNSSTLITFSQSIIAGNQNINGAPLQSEILNENGGNMQFDDFNLFGYENNSGFSINITPGASDLVPSAGLADIFDTNLTDNGGYTPTHELVPGSPAIDFIPAGSCASSTDQTGASRPIDGNLDGVAGCDVGAVEKPKPDLIFENGFEGGN